MRSRKDPRSRSSNFLAWAAVPVLAAGVLATTVPNAWALTINGTQAAGSAPGGTTGGGSLASIFDYAAGVWESLIPDTHTLTITYQWGNLTGSTIGLHSLVSQSGTPNRETAATLTFDNSSRDDYWFLDSTPGDNSEYTTHTVSVLDLGGGNMTVGDQWTGATGDAAGRGDLLSVVLHEIGHALGLSSANNSFIAERGDNDVDVTSGTFAGASIGLNASSAHTSIATSLMWPSTSSGTRTLVSQADLMANCQISQFSDCLSGTAPIPEPETYAMLFAGLGLLGWHARRRKLKQAI